MLTLMPAEAGMTVLEQVAAEVEETTKEEGEKVLGKVKEALPNLITSKECAFVRCSRASVMTRLVIGRMMPD